MKMRNLIIAGLLLFMILSAAIAADWEGSAAVSGDLPDKGYYVNTNSFPRNTVVDITNLENNKSIRVLVAGTLGSNGLLAVLSKEAANIIGMQTGSIYRIRMTQPSDPIAYLRFTENVESGIPVYDSGDVITEEKLRADESRRNEIVNVNDKPQASAYVLEPEWGGDYKPPIVSVTPDEVVKPEEIAKPEEVAKPEEIVKPEEIAKPEELTKPEEIAKPEDEYGYDDSLVKIDPTTEPEEEIFIAGEEVYVVKEEPVDDYIIEAIPEDNYEPKIVLIPEPIVPPKAEPLPSYALVPAEKRPPVSEDSVINQDIISGIIPEKQEELTMADKDFIDPIPEEIIAEEEPEEEILIVEAEEEEVLVVEEEPEEKILVVEEEPEEEVLVVEEEPEEEVLVVEEEPEEEILIVEEEPEEEIFIAEEEPKKVPGIIKAEGTLDYEKPLFSVPLIAKLENNSYYVQIASYNQAELVESAINTIDSTYMQVVCVENRNDAVYRILLGPLNQGESGAMLRRFKSIGYKDAFIRQE
jgi:hypothetical protein